VHIEINIGSQTLFVFDENQQLMSFSVATARKGVGEQNGSEQTPRGWHVIRAKIGANQPVNTVFIGRRPTGEIYTSALRAQAPKRDWILTRILWLSGLEPGRNRLGSVDTMRRYIYIHGCPDEEPMGLPSSHGCIKMHNQDVICLFNTVPVGTRVLIQE
jgi:L,D-transpeptidase YbiS